MTLALDFNGADRLVIYFLGFCPCFVVLCNNIEGLFYVAYSMTLILWTEVESMLRNIQHRHPQQADLKGRFAVYRLQMDDLRIAMFFLFFTQVGYFGAGKQVVFSYPECYIDGNQFRIYSVGSRA